MSSLSPPTRRFTMLNSTTTSSSSSANLLSTSPVAKTRPRRSMSSGSYGLDANGKELTAGQKKALEDKKGGKHVDVIDTWDPTGLGSASELNAAVSYFELIISVASFRTVRRCGSVSQPKLAHHQGTDARLQLAKRSTSRSDRSGSRAKPAQGAEHDLTGDPACSAYER